MGCVDLDHPESGHDGPAGSGLESSDNFINTGFVEHYRLRVAIIERHRARTEDGPATYRRRLETRSSLPRRLTTGLSPGMGQLNAGHCPLGVNKSRNPCKRLSMLIPPDPHISRRNPSVRGDGRGLDHHQRSPADGTAAEVDQMPIAC